MMTMPAISLHQPYASLLVTRQPGVDLRCDRFETRSWACPPDLIGQRMAFHAAARPIAGFMKIGDWCADRLGMWLEGDAPANSPLPLGAIVGSGIVTACYPIVAHLSTADRDCPFPCVAVTESRDYLYVIRGRNGHEDITNISDQLPCGDFTPGRFAWLIEDAAPTQERCPWCWGNGMGVNGPCSVCRWPANPLGAGRCEPIPAKGKQRIWNWTPEATR